MLKALRIQMMPDDFSEQHRRVTIKVDTSESSYAFMEVIPENDFQSCFDWMWERAHSELLRILCPKAPEKQDG